MLRPARSLRYPIAEILAAHWREFAKSAGEWIRPVVFENVRKVLACRTPVLGCHVYRCPGCTHTQLVPHSCKSRRCPTCGKHATDVWADRVRNDWLDVPYHHLVFSIPWQLRIGVLMNRWSALNLLVDAAKEAIAQGARDVKQRRMGILLVLHTFGSDLKWNPHVHVVVTGGGLSLDGKRWIDTDPKFLMNHAGLKKRWKVHVLTRMKQGHREGLWRLPKRLAYLKEYRCFAAMLNKLWQLTWYVHSGASLADPRFSVRYIGRYTKRAVLAEYRLTHYDGKWVRFLFKDSAEGGRHGYKTLGVLTFIGRLVRQVPDQHFPMIRYAGLFATRWRARYLELARAARAAQRACQALAKAFKTWAERQTEDRGHNPLICPNCARPLVLERTVFGPWLPPEALCAALGYPRTIPAVLRASP